MKIYLAGPMRGYPLFNFPLFDETTARLRAQGHEVFSPAEQDRADGFDGTKPEEVKDISWYMAQDLPHVCRADAVALLPGWAHSEGCKIEVAVAYALKKQILDSATLRPIYSYPTQNNTQHNAD